jgi:hypothetical protein
MEMGIQHATPTPDSGSGEGIEYLYTFPTDTPLSIAPYTIEGGDNIQAEVMEYCHVADFTLAGNEGSPWTMQANLGGRQITPTTFTTPVTIPDVTHANFGSSLLYVDSGSDDFGTTLVSYTLLQASVKYKTGLVMKFTADGALYFSFLQTTSPELLITLTLEHNTNSMGLKADWRSQTPLWLRLKTEGPTFVSPGTYSKYTMIIDAAGKFEKFAKLGERNGNNVLEGTFRSRYNKDTGKFGKIIVVNKLAALP